MKRFLILLATVLSVGVAAATDPAPPTTVYLVRHAEKASEPRRDPRLTPAGTARALELPRALADADLTAIITTQFLRSKATAEPVSVMTQLEPVVVHFRRRDFEANGRKVAEVIRTHYSGGAVLVVGHSDTVPSIIRALGGPEMGQLCEATEYASIFKLVVPAEGPTTLERISYGKPDAPLTPECIAAAGAG